MPRLPQALSLRHGYGLRRDMTFDEEGFELTKRYLAGEMPLRELFNWVFDREPYWGEQALGLPSGELASAVEGTTWEMEDGVLDEAQVRAEIAEAFATLTSTAPRP